MLRYNYPISSVIQQGIIIPRITHHLITPFIHQQNKQLVNPSTRLSINKTSNSLTRHLFYSSIKQITCQPVTSFTRQPIKQLVNPSTRQLVNYLSPSLSFRISASRCSTATSCGIFFSTQTCFLYRLTWLIPAPT